MPENPTFRFTLHAGTFSISGRAEIIGDEELVAYVDHRHAPMLKDLALERNIIKATVTLDTEPSRQRFKPVDGDREDTSS